MARIRMGLLLGMVVFISFALFLGSDGVPFKEKEILDRNKRYDATQRQQICTIETRNWLDESLEVWFDNRGHPRCYPNIQRFWMLYVMWMVVLIFIILPITFCCCADKNGRM